MDAISGLPSPDKALKVIEKATPLALQDGWDLYRLRRGDLVIDMDALRHQVLQRLDVGTTPVPEPAAEPEDSENFPFRTRWGALDLGEDIPAPVEAPRPSPGPAAPSPEPPTQSVPGVYPPTAGNPDPAQYRPRPTPTPLSAPTPVAQTSLDANPAEKLAGWGAWKRRNCSCSPLILRPCEVPGHAPEEG